MKHHNRELIAIRILPLHTQQTTREGREPKPLGETKYREWLDQEIEQRENENRMMDL